MDSYELKSYLNRNIVTRYLNGRVIAIDQLKMYLSPNLGEVYFIVNTHPHYLPGEHWFVIYCPKNVDLPIEIFDSAAQNPGSYHPSLVEFLQVWNRGFCYNTSKLQKSESIACGYFSLFYISQRAKGLSFASILDIFSQDLEKNEQIVRTYVL